MRSIRAWMIVPPVDAVMIGLPMLWAPENARALAALSALTVLLLTNGRCYRARLHLSVLDELPWLLARFATADAVVGTIKALRFDTPETASFLAVSLWSATLLVVGRVITTQIILRARRRGRVAHRTVVVGSGPLAAEIITVLERYPQYGLLVTGYVDETSAGDVAGVPFLGRAEDLRGVIEEHRIVAVLVADGPGETAILDLVQVPTRRRWELLVVPRLHQLHTQVGLPDHVGSIPVMRINNPALHGPAWALKRGFDIAVSVALLVLLLPLLAVLAVLVRLEGGPGVLFRQERVGRDGRVFTCLKFRTLRPTTDEEASTRWSVASDRRVGPVGRVIRRLSLDELPQLWNIVRGDMTLVGPRPERPHFVDKFSVEVPLYGSRHRVRAGLTGFAQVSGLRGDTPIVDRARFDNYYIENWSLWMDTKVLLRTVAEVLLARGR
ncbi:exopolysaccharide biosynthesis polyprenyl glycosylphosphotransferase [Actinomycetospora succinea]|uniref:Exopolysaccharide biosynthesis polyprenyl glycosylphosphotransferase n=1 Tax=Actinomycetospora succinea TaxID=663603 RepID=A0A4R6UPE9_9PSEU|nr:exopolysaccharide biosynthesis polyprenyl glycosylphosphotransferase [Actinomycetospora succinea]TDQ48871.1 exopolysaccharide biosynthesis polyprenyl glycosylphosphotransferase [Actinomycetospora succinea]